jgi:transcriptional regulator with XRE-family HTH domain
MVKEQAQCEKFGRKVKLMRGSKEMTQEDLANRVGIDRSSLANIEQGRHVPSIKVVSKLAETLDTTVDYLLSERQEKTKEDIANEPFAQFVLRASQDLTPDEKDKIKQIIEAWRQNKQQPKT